MDLAREAVSHVGVEGADLGRRMRRGDEALRSGEALYEEIDAELGRSNIDIEKYLRRAELKLAQPTPGLPWRGSWAGNGTTTAEHRGCRLRPQTGGGDRVEWTPEGWVTTDLVAGLRGGATPTAPAALPAAGRAWLTHFRCGGTVDGSLATALPEPDVQILRPSSLA